jgi:hypothetical protein
VSTHAAPVAAVPDEPEAALVVVLDDALFDDEPPPHDAATTPAPRPARSPIAWRRLTSSRLFGMGRFKKANLVAD